MHGAELVVVGATHAEDRRQLAFSLPGVSGVDHGQASDEEDLWVDDTERTVR